MPLWPHLSTKREHAPNALRQVTDQAYHKSRFFTLSHFSNGRQTRSYRRCMYRLHQHILTSVIIGAATGGKGGSLPPPQPPIGDPLRSIQIRGDFGVGKNGGRLSALRQIFELKIPSPFSPSVNFLQNSLRVFQSPANYSCL